jgi:hypothetical protein
MSHFSDHEDHLYRSHFLRVNRLADRSYEQVRPAYRLGQAAAADPFNEGCGFEAIEKDLENGWLNVRVNCGEWAAVREFVRAGFEGARQGRISNAPPSGESRHQVSYSDPLADGMDPTAPDSPEQRL